MVSSEGKGWGGGGGLGRVPCWNWSTPSILEKDNRVFTEHLLYAVDAPADIDQVRDLSYLIWVDSCEVGAPFPFHRWGNKGSITEANVPKVATWLATGRLQPSSVRPLKAFAAKFFLSTRARSLLPGFILRICLGRDKQLHTKFKGVAEQSNSPCPPTHTEK